MLAPEGDLPDRDLKVKQVLLDILELDVSPDQIPLTESLFSPLLRMDSLRAMQLISRLESAFLIEIDEADIVEVGFESVQNIVDLVSRCGRK